MKKSIERKCANCQWWNALEVRGRTAPCTAPLPVSMVGVYWRGKVRADAGADCTAHRLKVVRQKKLKLISEAA